MTGTEERALREALQLVRAGLSSREALKRVAYDYNLDTLSISIVATALGVST
jgi:hypothetical protein